MDSFSGIGGTMEINEAIWTIASRLSLNCRATILYIEDEQFVREVTREILQSAGYRVLVAGSAEEAQRICDHRVNIDLLLTDVVLPVESGTRFAARAKREKQQLKVLYVTGYPEQMTIRPAENEACLAKPYSADGLLQQVGRLLEPGEFPVPEDAVMHARVGV